MAVISNKNISLHINNFIVQRLSWYVLLTIYAIVSMKGKADLLALLDLSAAFDTVDHNILLDRMFKRLGIQNTSLPRFQSYLSDRSQAVQTDEFVSKSVSLLSVYPEPNCDITRKHATKIHSYADDTQLYLSSNVSDDVSECPKKTEECVSEIGERFAPRSPAS